VEHAFSTVGEYTSTKRNKGNLRVNKKTTSIPLNIANYNSIHWGSLMALTKLQICYSLLIKPPTWY